MAHREGGGSCLVAKSKEDNSGLDIHPHLTSRNSSLDCDKIMILPLAQSGISMLQDTADTSEKTTSRELKSLIHQGWEASNLATARCDFCQKKRRGTLQKCSTCKMSVCKECFSAGILSTDRRHALDPDTAIWDAPPNPRKRKTSTKANDADSESTNKKHSGQLNAAKRGINGQQMSSRLESTSSDLLEGGLHRYPIFTRGSKPQVFSAQTMLLHGGPIEPQFSVEPTSYYSSKPPSSQYHTRTDAGFRNIGRHPRRGYCGQNSGIHYNNTSCLRPTIPRHHESASAGALPASSHGASTPTTSSRWLAHFARY